MEKYKASSDFATEQDHAMVIFRALKEFFEDRLAFSQVAFEKGYELGKWECLTQVANHYLGLDLAFLDEQEGFEEEPSDHGEVTTFAIMVEASSMEPIAASKPIPLESTTMSELAPADLIIEHEPSLVEGATISFETIPTTANPSKKVRN